MSLMTSDSMSIMSFQTRLKMIMNLWSTGGIILSVCVSKPTATKEMRQFHPPTNPATQKSKIRKENQNYIMLDSKLIVQ